MSEGYTENEIREEMTEASGVRILQEEPKDKDDVLKVEGTPVEEMREEDGDSKNTISKNKMEIIGTIVAIAAVIAIISFIPSKFKRVENECEHIAGMISSGKGYFTIETIPDSWDNMDSTFREIMLPSHEKHALEAIKYANNELGFPGSVYSDMLNTNALMGRQTEETNKYKVSWTYHPDDGLKVTYSKK